VRNLISGAILTALCLTTPALAQNSYAERSWTEIQGAGGSAQDIGREIARERDSRDAGFGNYAVEGEMILRDTGGNESVREFTQRVLENPQSNAGDFSTILFHSPRDIAGTANLTHSNILDPDDQWLYLPAVRRTRRIASTNRSGAFVGSEFAYEDLASRELGKFDYEFIREDDCGENLPGAQCLVVRNVPLYDNSGYSYQDAYIDVEEFRPIRIDYYDRAGALLKTLTYHGYQEYLDQYWRADRLSVLNHQTGRSTDLVFENYDFSVSLDSGDFESDRLQRLR